VLRQGICDRARPCGSAISAKVGYAVADIESARDDLVSGGVRPVTEIEGDAQAGGRWCYFRDAEGNIFEIKERREQRPH